MIGETMSHAEMHQERAQEGRARDARQTLLETLPVTERFVRAAGVRTAVLEGGDGPPMVLLHGPGESALWWMRVLPELVSTHAVIVPELPGHGESVIADNPLTPAHVRSWLDEVIEHTTEDPPILVGHLLGGAIAARFAANHGDSVNRLVLVDSLGLGRFRPAPGFMLGLLRFMVRSNQRSYDNFLGHCMVDQGRLVSEMGDDWEPFVTYSLARSKSPGVKAAMRTLMTEIGIRRISPTTLDSISVPTALIWGREDKAIRLRIAQDAHDRYGWPLFVIDDAADDPKMEQPAAFLDALHETLGS